MGIFSRKKPTLNDIQLPDFGWELQENSSVTKEWASTEYPIILSLHMFNLPPDIPTMKNIDVVRDHFRQSLVNGNGGFIACEFISLQGLPVIKNIFKYPLEPSGINYIGAYIIPFKKHSFVIRFSTVEQGMTGIRDTVVASKWMKDKDNSLPIDQQMKGFAADPYDPEFTAGTLMNKSEEEQYDAEFDFHPLTHLRSALKRIEEEVSFSDLLMSLKKFDK